MFNIDEIDVDFNDETFDILSKKIIPIDNQSNEKGRLSYGIASDNVSAIYESYKRRRLDGDLSNQSHIAHSSNSISNNNEYNKITINQDLNSSICSLSYSPITSTQKTIIENNRGCLFDRSNTISPIKVKNARSTVAEQDDNFPDKMTFSFKHLTQTKLSNIISLPSSNPVTSTQINNRGNDIGHLFKENNLLSPIKIKPGICSELRNPPTKSFECVTRKFPGPAGCLPKAEIGQTRVIINQPKVTQPNENGNCSSGGQLGGRAVRDYPSSSPPEDTVSWQRVSDVIGHNCWNMFQRYTIANVLKMVSEPNGLFNSKIPVICLTLTEIEYLPIDAAAKLSDKTGSIRCAIHRSVLEKFNDKIKTGSTFILKKVSIFSPSGKKYYLNIVQSNVIDIISPEGDLATASQLQITTADIERIIRQCSEIPRINFDPQTTKIQNDAQNRELQKHHNPPQRTPSAAPQPLPELPPVDNAITDFLDDGMDEMLLSFMEESFTDI